jgi:hypothetical protein
MHELQAFYSQTDGFCSTAIFASSGLFRSIKTAAIFLLIDSLIDDVALLVDSQQVTIE